MANEIWQSRARRWAKIIGLLPFVRQIYLTGSIATGQATAQSDIDLLLIAAAGRLWTTRLFVACFLKLTAQYRRPNKVAGRFCPNYWLTEGQQPTIQTGDIQQRKIIYQRRQKIGLEWILSGRLGEWVEKTAKKWQIKKITQNDPKKWTDGRIKISDREVYFHQ